MTKIYAVAADEGAGRVKTVFRDDKNKVVVKITSSVSQDGIQLDNENEVIKGCFHLDDATTQTSMEKTIKPNSNLTPEAYQTSNENLVAVHNALMLAGFGGKKVKLLTSLPIGLFFDDRQGGKVNKELIQKKKDNLLRKVTPERDDVKVADIVEVLVVPESVTAFDNLMFNEKDEPKFDDYDEDNNYVVIDIGESTTDISSFYGDKTLTDEKFSIRFAVSDVRERLIREIDRELNIPINYMQAGTVLKTRKLANKNVGELIDKLLPQLYRNLEAEITKKLTSANTASKIFIIGGGANLFGPHFKGWNKNVVVPVNPDSALAESMLTILEGTMPKVPAEDQLELEVAE